MTIHKEFGWNAPDGKPIYGQAWVPADQPLRATVALMHGLGEHSGRYKHVAEWLGNKGVATYAIDAYGHGKSGGARGHIPAYSQLFDLMGTLVDYTRGQHPGVPCFAWGHSLGGNIVLNYTLRQQPRHLAGVVATSPFVRLAFEPAPLLLWLGRATRKLLPRFSQKNQLNLQHLSRDPNVVAAYAADPLVHDKVSSEMGIGAIEAGHWLLSAPHQAPVPILLVHGTADQITSASATEQLSRQLQGNVQYQPWPGLYHETHNEPQWAEVLQGIWNWAESHL